MLNETNRTCIDVLIRDDLQPEFEEYFKVYLLTLDSGGQSVYSVFVTVTIMDDEGWLLYTPIYRKVLFKWSFPYVTLSMYLMSLWYIL